MLLSGIYYGKTPIVRAYKSGDIIWSKGSDSYIYAPCLDLRLDNAAYITKAALEQLELEWNVQLANQANIQLMSFGESLMLLGGYCLIPTSSITVGDEHKFLLSEDIKSDNTSASVNLQFPTNVDVTEDALLQHVASADMNDVSCIESESLFIICSDDSLRCVKSENGDVEYRCIIDDDTQLYLFTTKNADVDESGILNTYANGQISSSAVSSTNENVLLCNESNIVCLFVPKGMIDVLTKISTEASTNVSASISTKADFTSTTLKDDVRIWIPKYIDVSYLEQFDFIHIATTSSSKTIPLFTIENLFANVSDDVLAHVSREDIMRSDDAHLFVGGHQNLILSTENNVCANYNDALMDVYAKIKNSLSHLVVASDSETQLSEVTLYNTDVLMTLLQCIVRSSCNNHIEKISPFGIVAQQHLKSLQSAIMTYFGSTSLDIKNDITANTMSEISFEMHPKVVPQTDICDVGNVSLSFWECPIKKRKNLFIRQVYESDPESGSSDDGDLKLY